MDAGESPIECTKSTSSASAVVDESFAALLLKETGCFVIGAGNVVGRNADDVRIVVVAVEPTGSNLLSDTIAISA